MDSNNNINNNNNNHDIIVWDNPADLRALVVRAVQVGPDDPHPVHVRAPAQ